MDNISIFVNKTKPDFSFGFLFEVPPCITPQSCEGGILHAVKCRTKTGEVGYHLPSIIHPTKIQHFL